jgi:[ribosomal protein S5]-alanine N-acetyltransferase
MTDVTMETERLLLRRFRIDDWKDLFEYLSDESVVKYEPYEPCGKAACMEMAEDRAKNDSFWAVCLKENGKLIGNVYFEWQEPKDFSTWEIGYVFNSAYHKKGYATESCKRILEYGFEELNAHRVIAMCNPENTSSWKLLERLGMRREGHMLQKAFFRRDEKGNPVWHDAYIYAILSDEWRVRN